MVKKLLMVAAMLPVFVVGLSGAASAAQASTNTQNQANGWAHFVVDDSQPGQVELRFISTRQFISCFEYRVDDQAPTGELNPNTEITDGRWRPHTCVTNTQATVTLDFCESVEVRMVFGAEADERFDWTAVPVEPGDCDEPVEEPSQPAVTTTETPATPAQPEAPQAAKPVGGVNAGAGTIVGTIAALVASTAAAGYGVLRLRKHGA